MSADRIGEIRARAQEWRAHPNVKGAAEAARRHDQLCDDVLELLGEVEQLRDALRTTLTVAEENTGAAEAELAVRPSDFASDWEKLAEARRVLGEAS